jgi:hypothetical protein
MESAKHILMGLGGVTILCVTLVTSGLYRVHIQRIGGSTVTIFNAPSEEEEAAVKLNAESVKCLREKRCKLLEDGTIAST